MFDTIVVALDGSDGSERALSLAVDLARRDNAKLVIAHVEEDITGKGGGPIHATEDEVQADIRRRAEELSGQGLAVSVEMRSVMLGAPSHAIADVADQVGADLIVVGTRGHSAITTLVLGSVARSLLHVARQPVLVVPPQSLPPIA
jgi:nucleotide-binding universal stress UspA family protein